ncbi:MAG: GntR family transcriptional regulator [Myxococcota bacterium]
MRRVSVADEVFEALARAILDGRFEAGSKLPSERTLAEELEASRVLVRQAIHRLGDLGLLRIRQGAATTVRALADVDDVRVLELLYRLGDPSEMNPYVIERQYMNGLSLLELASIRGTDEARQEILRITTEEAPVEGDDFLPFEQTFWLAVADASQNPIFRMELSWWYRTIGSSLPRPAIVAQTSIALRVAFHRELARRLVAREDAVAHYRAIVCPMLEGS